MLIGAHIQNIGTLAFNCNNTAQDTRQRSVKRLLIRVTARRRVRQVLMMVKTRRRASA